MFTSETILLSDGDKLRVTFPNPLYDVLDIRESEIVLSLIPNLKAVGLRPYTVSIEDPEHFLLFDMDGQGHSFRRRFSPMESGAVLRVRPSVIAQELPASLKLQIHIEPLEDNEKIDPVDRLLDVRTKESTLFYNALVWVVGRAEVLALIATVLLWWTDDARRRQKEQTELRQRIEGIKLLRFEKIEDFEKLSQLLFDVKNKIRKHSEYTELIEQEIQNACRALVDQNDHWSEMIRIISDKFFKDLSAQATTISDVLDNLNQFYKDILDDKVRSHYFSTIRCGLFQRVEDAELENTFASLIDCWRGGLYDGSSLIAEALVRIAFNGEDHPRPLALDILRRIFNNDDRLSALMRYPRLNNLLSHISELADLVAQTNKSVDEKSTSYLSKLLAEWLQNVGLQTNLFADAENYRNDDMLFETWVPPTGWDKLEISGNSISQFETSKDSDLCAYYLICFLRVPTFPINLTYGAAMESGDIIDAMLHTYTTDWFDLLSKNGEVFEEMPEIDQRILAELFIWSAGSYPALQNWIFSRAKIINASDEGNFGLVLRRIQKFADETKDINDRPGLPKRLSWLAVRPPGYEQSYLVGAIHQDNANVQYRNLLYLMPFLNEYRVYLKLFVSGSSLSNAEPNGFTTASRSQPMYWSPDSLRQILDARALKASGNRFPFAALLEPMNDPEGRLAQAANGSLSRLLQLGHRLIERHIQQPEITKYISEATLEATLQEWAEVR